MFLDFATFIVIDHMHSFFSHIFRKRVNFGFYTDCLSEDEGRGEMKTTDCRVARRSLQNSSLKFSEPNKCVLF